MIPKQGIDFGSEKVAEDQRLPVIRTPPVEGPHSHTRKIHTMGLLGLPMGVV